MVSNAGEGLQRADQGRPRTAFSYPDILTALDELDQRVIDTAVSARVFVRVLERKVDTLNIN